MAGRALRWADQQAPQLQSHSRFQHADHSHQPQTAAQRNLGERFPHLLQPDATSRPRESRERPNSDSGVFAHFVDPFGLAYHDQSRYSGVRTVVVRTLILFSRGLSPLGAVQDTGSSSRLPAALMFPLYREVR